MVALEAEGLVGAGEAVGNKARVALPVRQVQHEASRLVAEGALTGTGALEAAADDAGLALQAGGVEVEASSADLAVSQVGAQVAVGQTAQHASLVCLQNSSSCHIDS